MALKFTKKFDEDFAKNAKYNNGEYLIEHNGIILVGKTPMELKLKYQKEKIEALKLPQIQPTLKDLYKGTF